jgi:hypothetical protein
MASAHSVAATLHVGAETFPLLVSPQSIPLPPGGLVASFLFPPDNAYGAQAYDDASTAPGSIIFALRGRVTLDKKVHHAERANAAAALLLDATGDAIGPDLDAPTRLFMACVLQPHIAALQAALLAAPLGVPLSILPAPTALGLALSRQLAPLQAALALHGAAFFAQRDAAGHTALHLATRSSSPGAEEDGAAAPPPDDSGVLAFLLSPPLAAALDVNAQDGVKAHSALHVAVVNNALRAIALLCARGASPNLPRHSDWRQPLHLASTAPAMRLLHAAGASLDAPAADGATPLELAARRGCLPCTRFLVQAGCAVRPAAATSATGMARGYLSDVLCAELSALVRGKEDAYVLQVEAAARARLVADLGGFIEEEDVEVQVNSEDKCKVGEMFLARYRALCASYAATTTAPASAAAAAAAAAAEPSLPPLAQGRHAPLAFLWHGCDASITDEVLREGFKTSFSNLTFNVYGAGIYFATDAKLSAYFVTRNVREGVPLPPDARGRYSLLFAAVALGRTGVREALVGGNESEKKQMRADLKHPANRNAPLGCASATGTHLKEVIVYENSLAYPLALVSFRLKAPRGAAPAAACLPDPYAADAASRAFLRPLDALPVGLGRVFLGDERGAVAFDGAPWDIDRSARLIMGWRADARPAEQSQEELLERVAELEAQVALLQRENAALRGSGAAAAAAATGGGE